MATSYFGTVTTKAADQTGNLMFGDHTVATKYSVRVTTGKANEVTIDLCGAVAQVLPDKAPTTSGVKLRVDTHDNAGSFLATYVTPTLYLEDISAVAGDVSSGTLTNKDNIGKKLAEAPFLPMFFRTLCGDGLEVKNNRSFRVTLKDEDKIKNGMKLNIITKYDTSTANINITSTDICFGPNATNYPQALVNGGPLGADKAIPAFTAQMTKNATTASTGDIKIFTSVPMFKNGGDGIDLSNATFRIKEDKANGTETFKTLTIPTVEKDGNPVPNANGLYEYSLGSITNAAGKSYRVMNTSVRDKFLVYGYAMQASTNGVININNKPEAITVANIAVNADASGLDASFKTGTKAIVSFSAPNTAEGEKSIKKYEARWATKAQVDALNLGVYNFKVLEQYFPNQVNIQTDICTTTTFVDRNVTLTGLTHSVQNADGTPDNSTRYGVFLRAYTKDDNGNFVAGADTADVCANAWLVSTASLTNTTGNTDASLGFFVSGVPDAPTHVTIKTGKDLLIPTSNTATLQDASMDNNLVLAYNDYNVNQRGANYDSIRYAVVRASDAKWGDELADASFSTGTGAWNGNDSVAETLVIDGIGAVTHEYDQANSVWKVRGAAVDDISNGETFAIAYAFDNSNGMGFRSPWTNFVTSTHGDSSFGLFAPEPSSNLLRTGTAGTGSGWGEAVVAADSLIGLIKNDATFVGKDAALKERELAFRGDNKAVSFGFSFLDASGIAAKKAGQVYKPPATTDGGSEITGIRYFVYKSALAGAGETAAQVAARIYGAGYKDISSAATAPLGATFGQLVSANKDTNRLTVSKGYDASGALQDLKNGQRYDICFGIVNANGYNDLSLSILRGFAPLGKISGVKNLRPGSVACEMKDQQGAASTTSASFDLSFEDLSGVAEHGGHLVNQYRFTVKQYQGPVLGEKTVLDNSFVMQTTTTGVYAKAAAGDVRQLKITTGTNPVTLPGYPLTVSIHPVAVASTGNNDISGQNYLYQDGKTVCGETLSVLIPGPKLLATSADDEVRSLAVAPGDSKLTVSFYKPQNDALKNQYQGAPAVNAYYIYQYDMSLSTLGTTNERAMSRSVTVLSSAQDIAAEYVEKEISGINGKCYIIAVHTQWRYGANNDSLQVSQGVYHTNLTSSGSTSDVSLLAGNLYSFPDAARPTSGTGFTVANCRIPRAAPTITADNSKLVFDDNGDIIQVGAMIQVAPQNNTPAGQPAATTAFFLDLCANTGSVTGTTTVKQLPGPDGHALHRRTYDICATTVLGANWANEKNFVVIQNNAGSAYVKRNIE